MIDEDLWANSRRNPVKMLKEVTYDTFLNLEKNSQFISKYEKVFADFKKYVDEKPDSSLPSVAYFSMEYGLTNILKIYSVV